MSTMLKRPRGRPRKGLLYHKPSGRYYSNDPTTRKPRYFGRDKDEAEALFYFWRYHTDPHWRSLVDPHLPVCLPSGTEEGVRDRLKEAESKITDQQRMASATPQALPTAPQPTVCELHRLANQWAKTKNEDGVSKGHISETKRCWIEFCKIVRTLGATTLEQLTDKEVIKHYRSVIKRRGKAKSDKPDYYYSIRFRRIKAVINHIVDEYSYVTDQDAATIRSNIKLLKTKTTSSNNRPITPDELHALLAVCDHLAATDISIFKKQLRRYRPKSAEHQSIMGRIRQAENARFLGVEYKAVYLMAVNCLFYPIDIATIPRSAINLDGHVRFRRAKKNTPRVGMLFDETMQVLREWYACRKDQSEFVFVNVRGNQLDRNSVGKQLERHKEISAVLGNPLADDLSFSSFRDGGYAAALLDPHVDLYTAKVMSGHATGITDSYVDAQPERCRLAMESIRRHYFGGRK